MREDGFYWINDDGEMVIAEWRKGAWRLIDTHRDRGFPDDAFNEIDERRIIRHDVDGMEERTEG